VSKVAWKRTGFEKHEKAGIVLIAIYHLRGAANFGRRMQQGK